MATYNLELGPCQVYFGTAGAEADLGPTVGGVKVTSTVALAELHADQYGTAPYDKVITGLEATVEVPLADMKIQNFATVIPGATMYYQATPWKTLMQVKASVGTNLRSYAKQLILKKIVAGLASTDPEDWFTFPIAAFVTNVDINFDASTQRSLKATFSVFPDTDSKLLWYVGDSATPTT